MDRTQIHKEFQTTLNLTCIELRNYSNQYFSNRTFVQFQNSPNPEKPNFFRTQFHLSNKIGLQIHVVYPNPPKIPNFVPINWVRLYTKRDNIFLYMPNFMFTITALLKTVYKQASRYLSISL